MTPFTQFVVLLQVIVETDLEDFRVTPSQGSHFFQNLTSFQVGYLTVNRGQGTSRLNTAAAASTPLHRS